MSSGKGSEHHNVKLRQFDNISNIWAAFENKMLDYTMEHLCDLFSFFSSHAPRTVYVTQCARAAFELSAFGNAQPLQQHGAPCITCQVLPRAPIGNVTQQTARDDSQLQQLRTSVSSSVVPRAPETATARGEGRRSRELGGTSTERVEFIFALWIQEHVVKTTVESKQQTAK